MQRSFQELFSIRKVGKYSRLSEVGQILCDLKTKQTNKRSEIVTKSKLLKGFCVSQESH